MNQMSESAFLEPTWGRSIQIWWSLVWRSNLLGILTGLLIGSIAEIISRQFAVLPGRAGVITFFAVYFFMGILAVRWLLTSRFHSFRVVLVSRR